MECESWSVSHGLMECESWSVSQGLMECVPWSVSHMECESWSVSHGRYNRNHMCLLGLLNLRLGVRVSGPEARVSGF